MKTKWEEIKQRVELKVGEEIDGEDFVVLANEAMADLNEVAYITGAPMIYPEGYIKDRDDEFEITLDEIFKLADAKGEAGNKEFKITLPFMYATNHGTLSIKFDETSKTKSNSHFYFREVVPVNSESDEIIIIAPQAWNQYDKSVAGNVTGSLKIKNKIIRFYGDDKYNRKEFVIKLPDNLSSLIKLEIYTDKEVYECDEVSINSFSSNDYGFSVKNLDNVFYIEGDEAHIITGETIREVRVHYARKMKKLLSKDSLGVQEVELDSNFENLLTFSISHKWLENFVGTEDSETNNMFQKYQLLKKEYETKNLPKRTKRRQLSIMLR